MSEGITVQAAQFAFYLAAPGSSDQIVRPTAIYYDRTADEIYVAEQGHNRITIFDDKGAYKYEFSGGTYFTSPLDLAVDADGFIWILGATREGRSIFKFDFDGAYIQAFPIPSTLDGQNVTVNSFAMTPDGTIYLLDQFGQRVLTMSPAGQVSSSFNILTNLDDKTVTEQTVGKLRIYEGKIVIVSGTVGSAFIYDLDGKLERRVGQKGGEPGQMSLPAAAVLLPDSSVIILDKLSHNFVWFDASGMPVAQIGGRGISPGWFYQPTLLEIDGKGLIFIGQIYENKVQACRLPVLKTAEVETSGENAAVGSVDVNNEGGVESTPKNDNSDNYLESVLTKGTSMSATILHA